MAHHRPTILQQSIAGQAKTLLNGDLDLDLRAGGHEKWPNDTINIFSFETNSQRATINSFYFQLLFWKQLAAFCSITTVIHSVNVHNWTSEGSRILVEAHFTAV